MKMSSIFLGIIVILSAGCIAENFKLEKLSKSAQYDIHIQNVRKEYDCIVKNFMVEMPCTLVEIEFQNKIDKDIHIAIRKLAIVTSDGSQYGIYSIFSGLLNELCRESYNDLQDGFYLFPGAKKDIYLCFPVIKKDKEPILYLEVHKDGNIQNFKFNLTKYLVEEVQEEGEG